MLTGRTVTADEAYQRGLVSELVDDDRLLERALELAGLIAANSSLAVQMTKRALQVNTDAPDVTTATRVGEPQPGHHFCDRRSRSRPRAVVEALRRLEGAMRLGHVAFVVHDLDEMVAFYVETVGLQVSDIGTGAGRQNAPRIAFLSWDPRVQHHQLAFLELPADSNAPRNWHVAFEVDTLDDVRAVWNRVRTDGRARSMDRVADGPITAFIGDQWSIRFADPEGNGIEIYAPTPWDTRAASAPYTMSEYAFEPFDLDTDDDSLVAWGARHLETMGMEHWPRGQRPRPTSGERRANL